MFSKIFTDAFGQIDDQAKRAEQYDHIVAEFEKNFCQPNTFIVGHILPGADDRFCLMQLPDADAILYRDGSYRISSYDIYTVLEPLRPSAMQKECRRFEGLGPQSRADAYDSIKQDFIQRADDGDYSMFLLEGRDDDYCILGVADGHVVLRRDGNYQRAALVTVSD